MDEQLAAIYGTGQPEVTETDMEKAAAAELLVKLAADEGVDLDSFSDEEIAEMVQELYGQGGEIEQEKTAEQEKIAEADFLGRVMAHSYVQELGEIEKEAGVREHAGKALGWLKALPERIGRGVAEKHVGKAGERAGSAHVTERLKRFQEQTGKTPANVSDRLKSRLRDALAKERGTAAAAGESRRAKMIGGGILGGGALTVGGGVAGIHHALKEKKSAADIEKMAEEHALNLLYSQGWIDDQGNMLADPGQVKQASMTPEQAVEIRALQMLEENGFPVTWNE